MTREQIEARIAELSRRQLYDFRLNIEGEILALKSQLRQMTMIAPVKPLSDADWQLIETAPRNGEWLRVRGYNFGNPHRGRHYAIAFFQDGSWREIGGSNSILVFLTDWAPFCSTENNHDRS